MSRLEGNKRSQKGRWERGQLLTLIRLKWKQNLHTIYSIRQVLTNFDKSTFQEDLWSAHEYCGNPMEGAAHEVCALWVVKLGQDFRRCSWPTVSQWPRRFISYVPWFSRQPLGIIIQAGSPWEAWLGSHSGQAASTTRRHSGSQLWRDYCVKTQKPMTRIEKHSLRIFMWRTKTKINKKSTSKNRQG